MGEAYAQHFHRMWSSYFLHEWQTGHWEDLDNEQQSYGFRYLIQHLFWLCQSTGKYDALFELGDSDFLQRKLALLASPDLLEEDFKYFFDACEVSLDIKRLAHYGLERCWLTEEAKKMQLPGMAKLKINLSRTTGNEQLLTECLGQSKLIENPSIRLRVLVESIEALERTPDVLPLRKQFVIEWMPLLESGYDKGDVEDDWFYQYIRFLLIGNKNLNDVQQAIRITNLIGNSEGMRSKALTDISRKLAQMNEFNEAQSVLSQALQSCHEIEREKSYLLPHRIEKTPFLSSTLCYILAVVPLLNEISLIRNIFLKILLESANVDSGRAELYACIARVVLQINDAKLTRSTIEAILESGADGHPAFPTSTLILLTVLASTISSTNVKKDLVAREIHAINCSEIELTACGWLTLVELELLLRITSASYQLRDLLSGHGGEINFYLRQGPIIEFVIQTISDTVSLLAKLESSATSNKVFHYLISISNKYPDLKPKIAKELLVNGFVSEATNLYDTIDYELRGLLTIGHSLSRWDGFWKAGVVVIQLSNFGLAALLLPMAPLFKGMAQIIRSMRRFVKKMFFAFWLNIRKSRAHNLRSFVQDELKAKLDISDFEWLEQLTSSTEFDSHQEQFSLRLLSYLFLKQPNNDKDLNFVCSVAKVLSEDLPEVYTESVLNRLVADKATENPMILIELSRAYCKINENSSAAQFIVRLIQQNNSNQDYEFRENIVDVMGRWPGVLCHIEPKYLLLLLQSKDDSNSDDDLLLMYRLLRLVFKHRALIGSATEATSISRHLLYVASLLGSEFYYMVVTFLERFPWKEISTQGTDLTGINRLLTGRERLALVVRRSYIKVMSV